MDKLVFLEAGCGVGNTFFPLKQEIPKMFVHACDFSERAVQFIKVLFIRLKLILKRVRKLFVW